jgi:hypothetical protein
MANEEERGERPPLTEEELELLRTPDGELKERLSVFSFDVDRFVQRVEAGDGWQQLLQAHLYFDHIISRALSDALPKPDAINATRMSFIQKLQLVEAMGLIPEQIVRPIEAINSLRNRIAHDLDFELTAKEAHDIANATPKHLRDVITTTDGRSKGPITLAELLKVLVLQADILRQNRVVEREMYRKSTLRLRSVLDKAFPDH